MIGIIRKLEAQKFWGFIEGENGENYFFHRDDFSGHWEDLVLDWKQKNTIKVQFDTIQTQKGPRAEDVRRLDFPNQ